jgi:AcrR family transcriptional regulator
MAWSSAEQRVLDAARLCLERWGFSKVTVDDIADQAGISRATLYRLFPGGKDVLFEAMRARGLAEFFDELTIAVADAEDLESVVVACVVSATRQLRGDEHLAIMLASSPGETISRLTVAGMPQTIAVAVPALMPLVRPYLPERQCQELVELLARLVVSYFLAPSAHVDLGDPDSAGQFLRTFVIPAFAPALRS